LEAGGGRLESRAGRTALRVVAHLACFVPLAWMAFELAAGRIRGEWIKEITHRTGFWGLSFITLSLAITPLRRSFGWNALQPYRRVLGLWGFAYIATHFLIYFLLDKQVPFDPAAAWPEVVKDIAKRPYITVGFTGFLMLIPLAVTSTKGWIRRLGKRWTALHALVYVIGLAGVVHFTWSVKADHTRPTLFGLALITLLGARFLRRADLGRHLPFSGVSAGARTARGWCAARGWCRPLPSR